MSRIPDKLILGTRGSDLALTQARLVEAELRAAGHPGPVEIRIIKTIGDKRPDLKLSEFSRGDQPVVDKGIFTKELEEALLAGEIDAAVHSLKDVPTDLGPAFGIVATLERAPVEDVLLTRRPMPPGVPSDPTGLDGLTVATSSVRRARQLAWLCPGVTVVDIRGNVPTRVRKLVDTPAWDGILLARAGLERLGILPGAGAGAGAGEGAFDFEGHLLHAAILDPAAFLPAAGQGAVAIEALKTNAAAAAAAVLVNHRPTFARVAAERRFLHRLQAGCQTPVGALTWFEDGGGTLAMRARVFDEADPGAAPLEAVTRGPASDPESVADQLHALIHA